VIKIFHRSWLFVKKHKYKFLIAAIAVVVVAAVGTVSYSAGYDDGWGEGYDRGASDTDLIEAVITAIIPENQDS
jgi:hypothetical protein